VNPRRPVAIALWAPSVVGLNWKPRLQLAPGASVAVQSDVPPKAPASNPVVSVGSVTVPTLVMVTYWVELWPSFLTLPKSSPVGVIRNGLMPLR